MSDTLVLIKVRLSGEEMLEFDGICLGRVVALDHDDSVRRQFSVYSHETGYVAESIDRPGSIDSRSRAAPCQDVTDVYDFFGNEPLANYLYGVMRLRIPGMRVIEV